VGAAGGRRLKNGTLAPAANFGHIFSMKKAGKR
jgi:hypothetical protein